jgi:hypothetical protein
MLIALGFVYGLGRSRRGAGDFQRGLHRVLVEVCNGFDSQASNCRVGPIHNRSGYRKPLRLAGFLPAPCHLSRCLRLHGDCRHLFPIGHVLRTFEQHLISRVQVAKYLQQLAHRACGLNSNLLNMALLD